MSKTLLKIILVFFSWLAFILVVLRVDYPQSLPQASPFQLLAFFSSFFLATTSTLYLALKRFLPSIVFSVGIILLLLLKALGVLNIVTGVIVIIAVFLVAGSFKKKSSLTKQSNIPKLTNMRKHNSSSRT